MELNLQIIITGGKLKRTVYRRTSYREPSCKGNPKEKRAEFRFLSIPTRKWQQLQRNKKRIWRYLFSSGEPTLLWLLLHRRRPQRVAKGEENAFNSFPVLSIHSYLLHRMKRKGWQMNGSCFLTSFKELSPQFYSLPSSYVVIMYCLDRSLPHVTRILILFV